MNSGAAHPQDRSQIPITSTVVATLFDPSLPGGQSSGRIAIGATAVTLQSENQSIDLPLESLEVKLGGAGNRLLFLSHPSFPERSAYTLDHSLLKHPAFDEWAHLAQARGKVRRIKRLFWGTLVGMTILCIATLCGIWVARDPLINAAVDQIPVSIETTLGDSVITPLIDQANDLTPHNELMQPLRELFQPLLDQLADSPYTFNLYLIEDDSINAFAVPGGHIVVHSGLILKAETPEQIQGVLAHEIAHVARRHSLKQLVNQAGTMLVISVALGDLTSLNTLTAGYGSKLMSLGHSRDAEREADAFGVRLLQDAKINPRGLVGFFELLEAEHGTSAHTVSFMSTHPATGERINNLKAQLAKNKHEYPASAFNLTDYQAKLRSHLDPQ